MSTWHVPDDRLAEYLAGDLEAAHAMSVEAHLEGCDACRRRVTADDGWLTPSWRRLEAAVDRPPALERLLSRLGTPPHLARLLVATPALSRAWIVAVVAVLGFAVAAANVAGGDPRTALLFLATAPLLPLAGIALAYGPVVDPAYELQAATPLAGARLLLLRAAAVLAVAVLLTAIATPLLPGPLGRSVAWLLPALALTLACLTISTRVPLVTAASGLAAVWIAAIVATQSIDRFLLFGGGAQAVYAVALPLLALAMYAGRRRLDLV